MYIDDTDVIEYAIATEDSNCSLKYVGRSFGGEGYAIGLPRKSWLKVITLVCLVNVKARQ